MSIVLITGSSSGFGKHGALAFGRNGDTVYATMRDTDKAGSLIDIAAKENLDIKIRQLDVTQADTFPALIDEIITETGSIDVVINNAGMLIPGACEDLTETEIRTVMETNFFGAILLSKSVLPYMRQQGSGYIIMVSSLSGIAGLASDVIYAASKFAMEGATEALRHEVDRWGIRVALVQAGMHATSIFKSDPTTGSLLPASYPDDSPYRKLIENRLNSIEARIDEAEDPQKVGDLFVKIANSDGQQLRWPADALSEKVLATMFAQTDHERDNFLRDVSDIDWWSTGKDN